MQIRKLAWDKQAVVYFRKYINYIRKDSPQNAEKVKREVLRKITDYQKDRKFIILININRIMQVSTGRSRFIDSG